MCLLLAAPTSTHGVFTSFSLSQNCCSHFWKNKFGSMLVQGFLRVTAGGVGRHLNFRQISHGFTSSFINPSFQYLNGSHIMYWNMIILNSSRFKVEPHSKYWYFCIVCWDLLSLRFSENAVLFHIEWMCRKTTESVYRPPYCYTVVTHWACPPSSGSMVKHKSQNVTFCEL